MCIDSAPVSLEVSTCSTSSTLVRSAYALAVVFLVMIVAVESAAMVLQARPSWSVTDVAALRSVITADYRPGDLISVVPTDASLQVFASLNLPDLPLAMSDGDPIGFSRLIEIAVGSARSPGTDAWQLQSERRFGTVWLRVLQNPDPSPSLFDISESLRPENALVARSLSRAGGGACHWVSTQELDLHPSSGLAFAPSERFVCGPSPESFVGKVRIETPSGIVRRCVWIFAADTLRVSFPNVPAGKRLRITAGIPTPFAQAQATPRLRVKAGQNIVSERTLKAGDGFVTYDVSTPTRDANPGELVFEVEHDEQPRVPLCIDASVR